MKECAECGGTNYRNMNDSILKRKFPFVRNDNLMMCDDCGAKYITCDKCGDIFTRVHLSADVYGVSDSCPSCNTKNDLITQWINHGIESFGNR